MSNIPPAKRRRTNGSSGDDYLAELDLDAYLLGSITRISLTNFMTYSYCEFSPGPHLNVILGPNGSGKSSVVCAICLGLGGSPSVPGAYCLFFLTHPKVLGRAKNPKDYIKHGEEKATVEIDLKARKVRQTSRDVLTITRTIDKVLTLVLASCANSFYSRQISLFGT